MEIVYKPWGKEEWLELNDKYCYKRIHINSGFQTSYHYHEVKVETNYIIQGKAEVWLENDEGIVEKTLKSEGDVFTVIPPRKHRVVAITDTILQEVSSPEVDDVIRLEDDTNRPGGRLEQEHLKPGVLILAAGKGERLMPLTSYINKALLPINNQAVISKLIKKFPKDYKFVITLSHKGKDVEDYLQISFPEYDFEFVYVDDIESDSSGPGYSALCAESYLQRPFYLLTVDCLVTSPIPNLYENWLGVHPTGLPEKYATIKSDSDGHIIEIANKSSSGFEDAFIGIASISDYEVFWSELKSQMQKGELVDAFNNPSKYPDFKIKSLDWFDTGNLDDLEKARLFFDNQPLSLSKSNNEIVYNEQEKFIKFIPNSERLNNLFIRSQFISNYLPSNVTVKNNFLYYDWINGATLYQINKKEIYEKFLDFYFSNVDYIESKEEDFKKFYQEKTKSRINIFLEKNGNDFYDKKYKINGVEHNSLSEILKQLNFEQFNNNKYTKNFHGDLQFDNVLYSDEKFYYIDWRDSFGSSTDFGDVYYDLAKLYGGMLLPYNLMKNEKNISINCIYENIEFEYKTILELEDVSNYFLKLIKNENYDLNIVKTITGLIFINMSPLHDENFSKLLWFKGIELLDEHK